jgi:hypothetical protein
MQNVSGSRTIVLIHTHPHIRVHTILHYCVCIQGNIRRSGDDDDSDANERREKQREKKRKKVFITSIMLS